MNRKFWIVMHEHRFGVTNYPTFVDDEPTQEQMEQIVGDDYEPEREEFLNVDGPYEVPDAE